MKAPQPETLEDALALADAIRWVTDRRQIWTDEFVESRFKGDRLQALLDDWWETVWSDNQCRRIMTKYVEYKLGR